MSAIIDYVSGDTYSYEINGKTFVLSDEELDSIYHARKQKIDGGFESRSDISLFDTKTEVITQIVEVDEDGYAV